MVNISCRILDIEEIKRQLLQILLRLNYAWFNFQCQGLVIQGKVLQQNLTQEMTSGELKFALAVETVLNSIPQPEYRQLVVEALMVLTLVVEYKAVDNLGGMIIVEHLVHKANQIFLEDQVSIRNLLISNGVVTLSPYSGDSLGLDVWPTTSLNRES